MNRFWKDSTSRFRRLLSFYRQLFIDNCFDPIENFVASCLLQWSIKLHLDSKSIASHIILKGINHQVIKIYSESCYPSKKSFSRFCFLNAVINFWWRSAIFNHPAHLLRCKYRSSGNPSPRKLSSPTCVRRAQSSSLQRTCPSHDLRGELAWSSYRARICSLKDIKLLIKRQPWSLFNILNIDYWYRTLSSLGQLGW